MRLKRSYKNSKAFSGVQALGVVTLLIFATTFVVASQTRERYVSQVSFEKNDLEYIASELIGMLTEEEGVDTSGSTSWESNTEKVSSPGLAIKNYDDDSIGGDSSSNLFYPIDDLVVYDLKFVKTQEAQYCGDGICNTSLGESCLNCVDDCGICEFCGDGTCGATESSTSCCQDCGSICGDGVCNCGESSSSCVSDCGSECTPSCTGKECGHDGCGGSCGSCSIIDQCTHGHC